MKGNYFDTGPLFPAGCPGPTAKAPGPSREFAERIDWCIVASSPLRTQSLRPIGRTAQVAAVGLNSRREELSAIANDPASSEDAREAALQDLRLEFP